MVNVFLKKKKEMSRMNIKVKEFQLLSLPFLQTDINKIENAIFLPINRVFIASLKLLNNILFLIELNGILHSITSFQE